VTYYAKAEASEGHLKALEGRSPQIIHIATHGYFLPGGNDTLRKEAGLFNQFKTASNPLLRTGLIFAGANYVWSGKKPVEGIEDGIATAYEISQLDLNTTELVVLSACETGLGDINGSEGVYGLQRAFRMAGVKKLIVSLWQVPDKETSELMTLFYSNWLKGSSIRDAFSKAQKEMRKKYTPYYWAAFVLIE
jgi:CHAT domain-containing protein